MANDLGFHLGFCTAKSKQMGYLWRGSRCWGVACWTRRGDKGGCCGIDTVCVGADLGRFFLRYFCLFTLKEKNEVEIRIIRIN